MKKISNTKQGKPDLQTKQATNATKVQSNKFQTKQTSAKQEELLFEVLNIHIKLKCEGPIDSLNTVDSDKECFNVIRILNKYYAINHKLDKLTVFIHSNMDEYETWVFNTVLIRCEGYFFYFTSEKALYTYNILNEGVSEETFIELFETGQILRLDFSDMGDDGVRLKEIFSTGV